MKNLLLRASKLFRILQVSLWRKALQHYRVAASVEHEAVLRLLGPLDLIVDIGANRGQFSLLARHCFPYSTIISFEPLLKPAQKFRSVFSDDENITLFQSAVGCEKGELPIHVSGRDDSSSFLPITELQELVFPGTAEVATTYVSIAPLSSFLTADDIFGESLLKIDVQGFEYEALRGCEELINCFCHILCECSFVELYSGQQLASAVISWLASKGFSLVGVYNPCLDSAGLVIQADFLFKRQPPVN